MCDKTLSCTAVREVGTVARISMHHLACMPTTWWHLVIQQTVRGLLPSLIE